MFGLTSGKAAGCSLPSLIVRLVAGVAPMFFTVHAKVTAPSELLTRPTDDTATEFLLPKACMLLTKTPYTALPPTNTTRASTMTEIKGLTPRLRLRLHLNILFTCKREAPDF